jgi:hypothetical protein
MTPKRTVRRRPESSGRVTTFFALWCASTLLLFILAVITSVGVRHGHRLAAFLLLLSGVASLPHGARAARARSRLGVRGIDFASSSRAAMR